MVKTNDDILVQKFFSENRKEIEDNGFSRRVKRHLPEHYRRISTLWNIGIGAVAVFLFYYLGGVQLMMNTLREAFSGALHNEATTIDSKSLIMVVIVLLYLGYRKLFSLS